MSRPAWTQIRVHVANDSGLGRQITRRTMLKGGAAAAFLLGLPALAACSSDDDEAQENSEGSGGGGGGLTAFGFDGIIGATNLEQMNVELVPFSTTEEALTRLQAGADGLDLMVIDAAFVAAAVREGVFQPLPKDRLTNLGNLDPIVRNPAWDPEEEFTFVKDFGTVGWGFDRSVFPDGPGSTWGDVFDAIRGPASGKFIMYPEGGIMAVTYFLANGIDPTAPTDEQIDEAQRFWVEELAPHILEFSPLPESAVTQGTANLIMVASGYLRYALLDSGEPESWGFEAPQALRFVDVWGILSGAEEVDATVEFLDFMLTPEAAVNEMLEVGITVPVAGVELPEGTELAELVIRPESEVAASTDLIYGDRVARYTALFEAVQAAAAQ
jgi:spermidine/putrescine transport system substrate-binding protein